MRILVAVAGQAGGRVTGPEIRGWEIARALGRSHDVTVAVHSPEGITRDGMAVIPFTRWCIVREAHRYDAVITPTVPPYLFAALRDAPTVTVADQYDPIGIGFSLSSEERGTNRVLRSQRMSREMQLRFADVIACAGDRQRELTIHDLQAIPGLPDGLPPIVTVPFGLSDAPDVAKSHPLRARFPAIAADDPVVLWWGKVWKWFDAETALRAFELVVRQRPDARLVISAGKAPKEAFDQLAMTEEAREFARATGLLDRNVFFLDEWIPYDERHAYLQDADVGLTLHADMVEAPFAARARYMDYLWCTLPCVLARGDEVAEHFGTTGFAELVPPVDPMAASVAILRLIDDPPRREAAREAGRALAESYRWRALVEPMSAAIEVARGGPSRRRTGHLGRKVGAYYARRVTDRAAAFAGR